ncbi:MAG: biotin transporter BioY [candidate division KSB1 bacterium]|nr:biotin transporter BioY [candidate division KSB1 bacterium]
MTFSTKNLVMAGLFCALTAVGAFIRIPFAPAPFTLQTLFTVTAGLVLPARLAGISQAAYLIMGLAGLPIFANGGGPGYVAQPTFGYLLALPAAAWTCAQLFQTFRLNSLLWRAGVAATASQIMILAFGSLFVIRTYASCATSALCSAAGLFLWRHHFYSLPVD